MFSETVTKSLTKDGILHGFFAECLPDLHRISTPKAKDDNLPEHTSPAGIIGTAIDYAIRLDRGMVRPEDSSAVFQGARLKGHRDTRDITRDILKYDTPSKRAWLMAYYDTVFRIGEIRAGDFRDASGADLRHIEQAVVLSCHNLRPYDTYRFAPGFIISGDLGIIYGDGDFIGDTTLVDIKHTKRQNSNRIRDLRQVIAYAVMDRALDKPYGIDIVSVYYSRQGVQVIYSLDELVATGGKSTGINTPDRLFRTLLKQIST